MGYTDCLTCGYALPAAGPCPECGYAQRDRTTPAIVQTTRQRMRWLQKINAAWLLILILTWLGGPMLLGPVLMLLGWNVVLESMLVGAVCVGLYQCVMPMLALTTRENDLRARRMMVSISRITGVVAGTVFVITSLSSVTRSGGSLLGGWSSLPLRILFQACTAVSCYLVIRELPYARALFMRRLAHVLPPTTPSLQRPQIALICLSIAAPIVGLTTPYAVDLLAPIVMLWITSSTVRNFYSPFEGPTFERVLGNDDAPALHSLEKD